MKLLTPADANHPWSLLAAAMAALREGESAQAADLLTQVLQLPGNTGDRRTLALSYRALARAKAGQRDEARADLNELEELVLPFPDHPTLSPIVTRSNEMAVRLAMEETRSLIGSAACN